MNPVDRLLQVLAHGTVGALRDLENYALMQRESFFTIARVQPGE